MKKLLIAGLLLGLPMSGQAVAATPLADAQLDAVTSGVVVSLNSPPPSGKNPSVRLGRYPAGRQAAIVKLNRGNPARPGVVSLNR